MTPQEARLKQEQVNKMIEDWLKQIADDYELPDIECVCLHSSRLHCLPIPLAHPIGKSGCLKCQCVDFIESFWSEVSRLRDESN